MSKDELKGECGAAASSRADPDAELAAANDAFRLASVAANAELADQLEKFAKRARAELPAQRAKYSWVYWKGAWPLDRPKKRSAEQRVKAELAAAQHAADGEPGSPAADSKPLSLPLSMPLTVKAEPDSDSDPVTEIGYAVSNSI